MYHKIVSFSIFIYEDKNELIVSLKEPLILIFIPHRFQ